MSGFDITPEMMTGIAKDIQKKIEEWNMAVKDIYSTYSQLDTQFEGKANERINAAMAADRPKYEALSALMSEYANVIIKAAVDYTEADQQAANAIARANNV